ncbi:DNA gyrase inhibitor YacG [Falsiroseomonas sp. E2-1-a4]|uniref:DNA gyrase inhibitor YacG n=1 Tax=Falsiroseomonas sp. E2-1-a4 TaxID=3239299 RepID=UPI003F3E3759
MTQPQVPPRRARRCPICSRPLPGPASRFCSDRCASVDLGRWLRGDYAIPVHEDPDPVDES